MKYVSCSYQFQCNVVFIAGKLILVTNKNLLKAKLFFFVKFIKEKVKYKS